MNDTNDKFAKAKLQEIEDKPKKPIKVVKTIDVQINPATLRLQSTASVESGRDTGRQRTQYQGTTSTLSFDLIFDTSDEGESDAPVDVRKRTAELERFVWPKAKKAAPPRVQFLYGTLSVAGVMTSVNIDFDLFSHNGVPLRAKCAVQIKEQKTEFDLAMDGAGANTGVGAQEPLKPPTGSAAPSGAADPTPPPTDRSAAALAGESAPSFANRMGLDPKAWKGLQGIADPMNLVAGQQIDFPSDLSLDPGIGLQEGATASLATAADPERRPPATRTPPALALTGHALTSAGGLTNALNELAATSADIAARQAKSSFESPGRSESPAVRPVPPPTSATPAAVRAAPGPVTIDARATSYGYGAPLRPRRQTVGPTTLGLVHKRRRGVMAGGELPPESRDSTVPGWQALSAGGSPAASGDACRCRCGCGCAPMAPSLAGECQGGCS